MKKKKKRDILLPLKFKGYCMSEGKHPEDEGMSLSDFARYAKFQLCEERKVLTKDPIWDTYTDEELIIEYFAILCSKDEGLKKEFEGIFSGTLTESDYEWMERMAAQEEKAIDDMKDSEEENEDFEFDPSKDGDI